MKQADIDYLDIEKGVIGAILQESQLLPRIAEIISAECFSTRSLKTIYLKFLEMQKQGIEIDIATVNEFISPEELVRLGGSPFLVACFDSVPKIENVGEYAKMIYSRWAIAEFTKSLTEASELAKTQGVEFAANFVKDASIRVTERNSKGGFRHVSEPLKDWFEEFENGLQDPLAVQKRFLPTGIREYDYKFYGLRVGLNILGGRPAMGKTSYALTEAMNMAAAGKTVLFISLEMHFEELVDRWISAISGVDSARLTTFQINQAAGELDSVINAFGILAEMNIYLDNVNRLDQIIGAIERWRLANKRSPDVIFIDYLQLVESGENHKEYEEISAVSQKLMRYFKFDIKRPCRLLCQLSRRLEDRNDKRPINSDIRGSGKIEQDADVIDFIYRDDYYHPETIDKGVTEIIRAKSRQCSTGTVKLRFNPETTHFDSLPPQRNY